MSKHQGLINRALKNGFDLTTLPNYKPAKFKQRLYDYFVERKYFVMEEGESFFISYNVASDVAEISIIDGTLLITPLEEEGFFDVFMEVMKFITSECEEPTAEEDETTDSYSEETLKKVLDEDDDDSEEMWI